MHSTKEVSWEVEDQILHQLVGESFAVSRCRVVSVKDADVIHSCSDLEVLPFVVVVDMDGQFRLGIGVGTDVRKGVPGAFVSEHLADGLVLEVARDSLIPGGADRSRSRSRSRSVIFLVLARGASPFIAFLTNELAFLVALDTETSDFRIFGFRSVKVLGTHRLALFLCLAVNMETGSADGTPLAYNGGWESSFTFKAFHHSITFLVVRVVFLLLLQVLLARITVILVFNALSVAVAVLALLLYPVLVFCVAVLAVVARVSPAIFPVSESANSGVALLANILPVLVALLADR